MFIELERACLFIDFKVNAYLKLCFMASQQDAGFTVINT